MRKGHVVLVISLLGACTSKDASHLPQNPLMIPVYGISSGISNATYNARRTRVSDYVDEHHTAILSDISANGGEILSAAADLARVPTARRAQLLKALREDKPLYARDREALVVALMVHGN